MSLPAHAMDSGEDEPADPSGLVGRTLDDRFRVTGLLGVGGIGRVYRAEHLVLKRPVALKVLLEHYQCVPELQRRFEREAMALAALSHPNIVTITDFVSSRDVTFLVMELVEGRDLDEILEEDGALEPAQAFSVMEQILSCLAYAHERDVIHRDLKPQNVLVRELPGGRLHAEVLDFGLAKFMDGSGPGANLTKTGLIVGTPAYMAPEQASGAHADRRADVYAAGIMFYEMLAGLHPFEGFEGQDLLRQHLLTPAPPLGEACPEAKVAPELEAFLARALAKDGADRFADGAAMLDAFLDLPPHAFVQGALDSSEPKVRAGAPTAVAMTSPAVPSAVTASRAATRKPRLVLGLVAMAALTLVAIAVYLVIASPSAPDAPDAPVVAEPPGEEGTEALAPEDEAALAAADQEAEASEADLEAALAEPAPDEDSEDAEDAEDADDTEATATEDDPSADDPEPPPADRPGARNPWRGRTPALLARVRRRISRGHTITRGHIRLVQQYRRRHPRDVRATLVLGRMSATKGWLSAALGHYRRAYRRDPSARGDPHMLRDMVRIAATETLHEDATEALIEIYGREARATVRRAAARERDPEDRARLRDTYERL
ncbi:MAG TPA: protein kinase [Sandaracinaceae bacterium LLY-WYZ-13_1]|nr:protein kinase [Sandaracinaceae bacterium LLY-WYZ-13_1]